MDRRELLQLGAATVAATTLAKSALAQNAPAAAAPVTNKLKINCYSRHLLWLKTAEEVAKAAIEMAYDGVDITVRPGAQGHVDPARVGTDLAPFVNTIRSHGLIVNSITCPIADADSPNAEAIMDAASKLDIHHYWWGTYRYDQTKPLWPQLDALKPRVAKLARLNEKYGMKAMYHNYSGPGTVGSAIFDLLSVLREFDSRWVSFHYDTGHAVEAGGINTWVLGLRAAGPYVGGLSVKDALIHLNLEVDQGGPFTGTPEELNPPRGAGRGGPPGAPPGAPGAAAGAAAGRGGPGAAAAEQAAAERGVAAPGGAGGARGGAAGGAGGAGGGAGGARGGAAAGAAAPDPRGGGGLTNPWRNVSVPLGQGLVDLPLLAQVLKEINFNGPVEIQSEYPNGGANNAATTLTLPRIQVLGAMKNDLLTLKAAFGPAGLI